MAEDNQPEDNFIAEGTFGKVYALSGKEAFKLCKDVFVDSYTEIDILLRLRHQNLLHSTGIDFDGPHLLIKMPLIENRLLSYARRCNYQNRLVLLAGITNGIVYLHANNYLHLDLCERNILVNGAGIPKILDFGHSTYFQKLPAITPHEKITISYRAIEHIKFDMHLESLASEDEHKNEIVERTYDISTDVWSLGIVFIEVLLNQLLVYEDLSLNAMLNNARALTQPEFIEMLLNNGSLVPLVSQMLRRKPHRRITPPKILEVLKEHGADPIEAKDVAPPLLPVNPPSDPEAVNKVIPNFLKLDSVKQADLRSRLVAVDIIHRCFQAGDDEEMFMISALNISTRLFNPLYYEVVTQHIYPDVEKEILLRLGGQIFRQAKIYRLEKLARSKISYDRVLLNAARYSEI